MYCPFIFQKKKMCRKLKKMYFPAEMLKLMLCIHERLLQEAPCQRGMTNKENLCSELASLSCVRCKGGRGTRPSSRAAVGPVAAPREGGLLSHGGAQVAPLWETKFPRLNSSGPFPWLCCGLRQLQPSALDVAAFRWLPSAPLMSSAAFFIKKHMKDARGSG